MKYEFVISHPTDEGKPSIKVVGVGAAGVECAMYAEFMVWSHSYPIIGTAPRRLDMVLAILSDCESRECREALAELEQARGTGALTAALPVSRGDAAGLVGQVDAVLLTGAADGALQALGETVFRLLHIPHEASYLRLDFNDLRRFLANAGLVYAGLGSASGSDRGPEAAGQSLRGAAALGQANRVLCAITCPEEGDPEQIEGVLSCVQKTARVESSNILAGVHCEKGTKDELRLFTLLAGFTN